MPEASASRTRQIDTSVPRNGSLYTGRARKLLGYQPSTAIREGVEAFVRWYREVARARIP